MSIELEARTSETAIGAYSTLAAIAQSFGAKDAVKKLLRGMGASSSVTDSLPMSELRKRMGSLIKMEDKRGASKREAG